MSNADKDRSGDTQDGWSEDEEQVCLRKKKLSEGLANKFIKKRRKHVLLFKYKCPYGDHWHLTKRKDRIK